MWYRSPTSTLIVSQMIYLRQFRTYTQAQIIMNQTPPSPCNLLSTHDIVYIVFWTAPSCSVGSWLFFLIFNYYGWSARTAKYLFRPALNLVPGVIIVNNRNKTRINNKEAVHGTWCNWQQYSDTSSRHHKNCTILVLVVLSIKTNFTKPLQTNKGKHNTAIVLLMELWCTRRSVHKSIISLQAHTLY